MVARPRRDDGEAAELTEDEEVEGSQPADRRRGKYNNRELILRFWPFARPDAALLVVGFFAVPLMSLAGVAQPWLIKEAIDGPIMAATAGGAPYLGMSLTRISLMFLAAVLGEFLLRGGQMYALQRLGYRALRRLRRAVFKHLMRQGMAFYDRRATGSLLSRATNDVESLSEVLTFGIVGIFGDIFAIGSIAVMMLALNVELTAISLLAAPVIVLIVNLFRRRLRHYSGEIRRSMSIATGFFAEAVTGHRIVQMHGREDATVQEYKKLNHRYLRAYHRANWYDASLYAIMDGVAGVCIALLIWYGSGLHASGAVTLGLLVAFIQYIQRLFVPVRELSGKVATIERALAALERIFELLDVDARLSSGAHAPTEIRGEVSVRDLSFRYGEGGPLALDGINLHVAAGEVVALVGPTGSGKSTLAKLLTRTYPGPPGTIALDGVAIEDWDLTALRRAIAVVQQDVVLFSGTIADNVALGDERMGQDAIAAALTAARMDGRVARLGGAQGALSEHGGNLSAGERQLLSIARVLVRDPPVVILDEATASIDSLTERDVQRAIEEILVGRTVIVVAHRLSTIRKADRIVVIDRGQVVEQGDHDTLMANGGLYAHLVETALARDETLTAEPA